MIIHKQFIYIAELFLMWWKPHTHTHTTPQHTTPHHKQQSKNAMLNFWHGTLGRFFVVTWSFGVALLLVQLHTLMPFPASSALHGIADESSAVAVSDFNVVATDNLSTGHLWVGAIPSLNGTTLDPKRKTDSKKLRIAIVVTADDKYAAKYQWHTDSVRCYAEQHGYGYVRVASRDMHQRHSVVLNNMEHFDWLMFLDGDSMVPNHAT
jgi:hypothetical protein